jgi:hypothetical protein
MKRLCFAVTGLVASFGVIHSAHAQKEAIGMFYEMQLAPAVCKWSNPGDGKKLAATIAAQEQALGVSASDKADMTKKADAELRSDPSNCAPDGILRAMYDEAIK